MNETLKNKLRARVIEEQDIVVYFWYNAFEEQLFSEQIDSEYDMTYWDFGNIFLVNNLDIIPELSMNNLVYLLSSNNNEIVQLAKEQIMQRFENGEHIFSGENSELDAFGVRVSAWQTAFSKLGKENIEKFKAILDRKERELKESNPRVYELLCKFPTYIGMDNFLSCYENGSITLDKLELLEKLALENPNMLNTINFRIFDDEIFEMGEEFISRIAKFPNFSNKLINLAKNNPELFQIVKKHFTELEQTQTIQEALDIEYKILGYITRNAISIKGNIDFESLANCAIRNHEIIGNISIDYTENYEEEFEKECDKQYARNPILEEKKNILFNKYFGMSLYNAEDFFIRYIKNIDQIQLQQQDIKDYIAEVARVLQVEDEAELDKIYYSARKMATPLQNIHFEYELRDAYTKTFVQALNETHNNLNGTEEVQYIEFQGEKIKQIKLNGKFNLLVHSTDSGFKEEKNIEKGILNAWKHQKDPSAHLASSCFMTQDFLGHVPANEKGVLAVFTSVNSKDLSLMGPSDINSHIRNYNYESGDGMYMSAENLPYYSRRIYSEVPVERKKPDYFLLFDDSSEEVVQNTYKAALEFGVSVCFIDKKEIVEQQIQNLKELMTQFKESGDLSILQNLVSTYETNVAGWLLNRDSSEIDDSLTSNINNERFREHFEQIEASIYTIIGEYIQENRGKTDFSQKLIQISRNNARRN